MYIRISIGYMYMNYMYMYIFICTHISCWFCFSEETSYSSEHNSKLQQLLSTGDWLFQWHSSSFLLTFTQVQKAQCAFLLLLWHSDAKSVKEKEPTVAPCTFQLICVPTYGVQKRNWVLQTPVGIITSMQMSGGI